MPLGGGQGQAVEGPGLDCAALFQKAFQRRPAHFVPLAARQIARLALNDKALQIEGRAAGLAQRPLDGAALVLFRLPGGVPGVGDGGVALAVGGGELAALLFAVQGKAHRHPGHLPAVQLPQRGHHCLAGGAVLSGAHPEHGAVDLPFDVTIRKTRTGKYIL